MPREEQGKAALTELFEPLKTDEHPGHRRERRQPDRRSCAGVRFEGWQSTIRGDQEVRRRSERRYMSSSRSATTMSSRRPSGMSGSTTDGQRSRRRASSNRMGGLPDRSHARSSVLIYAMSLVSVFHPYLLTDPRALTSARWMFRSQALNFVFVSDSATTVSRAQVAGLQVSQGLRSPSGARGTPTSRRRSPGTATGSTSTM